MYGFPIESNHSIPGQQPTHDHPVISPCDWCLNATFFFSLSKSLIFGFGLGKEYWLCMTTAMRAAPSLLTEAFHVSEWRPPSLIYMGSIPLTPHLPRVSLCVGRGSGERAPQDLLQVAVCRVNTSNYRVPVQPWKYKTSMENLFDNYQVLKNVSVCGNVWARIHGYLEGLFACAIQWHGLEANIKIQLRDLCLSKLWKYEMANIRLCCNDVGECDTLDSPWTIKCTTPAPPKDSQRPLPVNKLCLCPALFVRQQQQKAADKRSLASFVVHCTSSRQLLLWAVM